MSSPSLRVPHPPTSFVAWQDIKQHNSLPEACYLSLFHACKQTLGPSREHERDDGHAPEVQGPATTSQKDGADHWSLLFVD